MKNDNLQYGAVIELEDISTKQIEILQTKFYLKYLKKKISKMIKEEGISYFINFAIYLTKGLKDGLNIKYLTPYYHIYAYDHITK